MGFQDLAKSAGNALLENIGVIEKAIISIEDRRPAELAEEDVVKPLASKGSLMGGLGKQFADARELFGNAVGIELDKIGLNSSVKQYVVQFNPSSFQLSAFGGGFMPSINYGDGERSASQEKKSVDITMSVKLIIDQVNNFDAFMEDKRNVSPTQLGQNIAGAVMSATGKKEISVQTITEGFIAALRSPYTRNICFTWGEMSYSGVLNNVTANYVMFNVHGQPIRSYVNLSLRVVDEDSNPDHLGCWENAYKKAFSGDELDLLKSSQKVGNLLNLG